MEVLSPQYVAGFIDGEGSFGIYKDKNKTSYCPRVSISNTNRKCLELIQKQYGGSINTKKKMIKGVPHYCYELYVRSEKEMRALVADVLPYLVVRKEQAKVFQQSLDGLMPKAHAALRLKAMKRAVNVTNIEATGVEYNLVLAQASRDAASQG